MTEIYKQALTTYNAWQEKSRALLFYGTLKRKFYDFQDWQTASRSKNTL
jgi:hypothetical protein